MKSTSLLMISCLGFILLTAMDNRKHSKPMSSWVKLSGSDGKDICVTDKGEFWLVNTVGKIYRYEGPKWNQLMIQVKNIKFFTQNKGIRLVYSDNSWSIVDCARPPNLLTFNGRGYFDETDVAVGADSTIWNLTYSSEKTSYASKCGIKTKLPGPPISRIAAGLDIVWMIDTKGVIYRLKDLKHIGMGWEQMGTGGRDITVSNENYVFMVNNQGRIFQWTGFKWNQIDGSDGLRIAANNRKLLLINTDREIYTRNY